jgi:phosphatidyl-myo-inositol dimannoside synthase
MRILALVTDAFGGHGGIAKFNRDLLTALCNTPDVDRVVALPRLMGHAPGAIPEKLKFDTSGLGGKVRYVFAVLRAAFKYRDSTLILCGHINLLPIAFVARALSCSLGSSNRLPVLLIVHGIDAWQPTDSGLVNRLVRKVNVVVAVSEFTRRKFWTWAQPISALSFILPNCVNLQQFTPDSKSIALQDRYGLRNKIVLLTVARLAEQERYKGIDEVIEALPKLTCKIPNLCYLVVGDGTDRERLKQKVKQLDLEGCVIFAGHIPEMEKPDHYRLADAFVMPGWGEGFGIVYLEAMACGVPVVASTLDASQEAVMGGRIGTLVNPRVPGEVVDGILAALNKARGVPPELKQFSDSSFQQRVHEIFRNLAAA